MNIKSFVKQITPPIVIHLLKEMMKSRRQYTSYDVASLACQNEAYQSSELVNVVVDKNAIYREQIKIKPIFDLAILRTLVGLVGVSVPGKLRVIDFGGGGGYHYTIAKSVLCKDRSIRWCVVETSAMTHAAERLSNDELHFYNDINEASLTFDELDLVFTSGALQYCPDPLSYLRKLVDLDPKFLYITRTPFLDSLDQIVTTQVSKLSSNGPGALPEGYVDKKIKYPITYISRQKVEDLIVEKYEIKFKIDEGSGGFGFRNSAIAMTGYFCVRK